MSAKNDSIPLERKRSSSTRRIPSMSNPKTLLPNSDSPFKSPLQLENRRSSKPSLEKNEIPYANILTTKGKSAEDNLVDPWGFVLTDRYLDRWYRNILLDLESF